MTTFSVVTIVYNDHLHISETMDSVINQSYKNIEYILIDGESSDGTKEIIQNYLHTHTRITHKAINDGQIYMEAVHIDCPTLTFKFLSEKDKGIYDAMNKGIFLATKEWINFMNCGDRFYNLEVLEKIANKNIMEYDVVYGDACVFFPDQQVTIERKAPDNPDHLYKFFAGFNHQAFFFKTSLHRSFPYSMQYKLASDYDCIYSLFKINKSFKHIHSFISIFTQGGSSDCHGFLSTKEAFQISLLYNQNSKTRVYIYYVFALIKKTVKLYTPKFIMSPILFLWKKSNK